MRLPRFLLEALGARPDERVVREYNKLLRLQEITRALNSELDASKLLRIIMDSVVELTGAERGFLILTDPEDGKVRVEVARNLDREDLKRASFKFSRSIADRVLETGEPVLTDSASEDDELEHSKSIASLKLLSVLCVPLRGRDKTLLGVIYVDNRFRRGNFAQEHLEILVLFADQAAVAIENARLHGDLLRAQGELATLNEQLLERVDGQQREIESVRSELAEANRELRTKYDYGGIVGRSAAMQRVFKLLDRVTDTDVPGPHPGGERHRQGARRASDPLQRTARREAVLLRELRRDQRGASRVGALRARAGRVHRSDRESPGPLRGGR
jgi:serine/threonine-protein kinase PknK